MDKKMYETIFVVTPELDVQEYDGIVEKFTNIAKDGGVTIINMERWGFKKLAYPIKKKVTGYFVFIEFEGTGNFITKLEREYEYDERVIRYLTVRLDKHAIAFNNKRRDKLNNRSYSPDSATEGKKEGVGGSLNLEKKEAKA